MPTENNIEEFLVVYKDRKMQHPRYDTESSGIEFIVFTGLWEHGSELETYIVEVKYLPTKSTGNGKLIVDRLLISARLNKLSGWHCIDDREEPTQDVVKQCRCESFALFNFGCKCGGV